MLFRSGPQKFDPKLLSDPVIRRADGSWLYMLPSAIDDIDMGITHVVRGEDHVTNTATQIQMFEALGATPPSFAHEALLTGKEGKLSKRLGSLGMDSFKDKGIEPISLAALLGRLGTSDPVEPVTTLEPLIVSIDFGRFGRAPARFDDEELATLNARILHQMPYADVAARLPDGMDEAAWNAIRPNLMRLSHVEPWWQIVKGPVVSEREEQDADYLVAAADAASTIEWTNDPWSALTAALKASTNRTGKALFLPLRRALTGMDHGPDM